MNLDRFFQEKDILEEIYEVEHEGKLHIIPTTTVIDAIHRSSGEERRQLKNFILRIDLINGDFHHFLRHLAHGLAANYRGVLS